MLQGARNIYTQDSIFSEFLSSSPVGKPASVCGTTTHSPSKDMASDVQQKRDVLIFHCEFSSERGPNLLVDKPVLLLPANYITIIV
jgi:hypothetical protein